MRKVIFITLLLATLLILVSCGGPEKAIIGSWQCDDGSTLQFLKDGTLIVDDGSGLTLSGTYSFQDKEHINVQLNGLLAFAGSQVLPVDVSGDTLIIEGSTCKKIK